MDGVRYGILGTTQAHHEDGTPVPLGGARLRALLAALALRPGRVRSVDALISDVWDGDPGAPGTGGTVPRDAGGALHALIGRLRRAIGRTAIVSVDGGYLLQTDPDSIDLHRFERLAQDGARALDEGDPALAADLLDAALALWRGPALSDLPSRTALAARAEARHLDARRNRARADLALGRAAHALPVLTELCGAHPLDESLHALRIRALRATGRTAEALAAYEQVRRELASRLGTDPSAELRTLHAELLTPAPTHHPAPPAAEDSPRPAADPSPPHAEPPSDAAPHGGGSYGSGSYGDGSYGDASHGSGPYGDASAGAEATPGPTVGAPGATDNRGAGAGAGAGTSTSTSVGVAAGAGRGDAAGTGAVDGAGPSTDAGAGAVDRVGGGSEAELSSGALSGASAETPSEGAGPDHRGTAGEAQPVAAAVVPSSGNLRSSLTSFVGRERDLQALRADLRTQRLVTLLGPGGSGKTRLSKVAAASVATDWPDGVWLAELAPAHDPDTVVETVLTTLGARETVIRGSAAEELGVTADLATRDPLARLTEHCAARRMLLILDNCEHVIEAAARLAETLLASCPEVTVLATSREPLAVPGELVRSVDPLPQPVALRLLADRGASARPGFQVDDDPEACAEICRRLDGLPLAIELAAARLRLLSPRQLADRLDDRFRLLTSGSRTLLPRQQTLRAVVDWSWDLLDERERAVLRRLSVFAGGCDLASAEAVCADPGVGAGPALDAHPGLAPDAGAAFDPHPGPDPSADGLPTATPTEHAVDPRDVAALLGSLVDKSLVVAGPTDAAGPGVGPGDGRARRRPEPLRAGPTGPDIELSADLGRDDSMRYRLLETVAEYAAERLDETGERPAVERRHLVAYRELARRADPLLRGADQGGWLWTLEREHENLRTALRRAVAAGDEHEALCLVLSLHWFWHLRGHRADLRTWASAASELGPNPFLPPVTVAPPLTARPIDTPPPMAPDQLQEARRGVRLLALAILEGDLHQMEQPEVKRQLQGLAASYRPGLPQTCRMPGVLWFFAALMAGEYAQLHEIVDASVRTSRALGDPWELAFALQLRAKVLSARHADPAALDDDIGESLEIFARLGDSWGAAEALAGRGELRESRGDYEAAADDYRQAIGYAERLGAQSQVSLLRARLAGLLIERAATEQEVEQGAQMLAEILAEGQRMSTEAMSYARLHYAILCAERGQLGQARRQFEQQLAEFGGRTHELFHGVMEGLLGWLDVLEGRPADALVRLRSALAKTQSSVTSTVVPQVPVAQLVTGAQALAGLGGTERARAAARMIGTHDAQYPAALHLGRVHQAQRTQAEATARALLTDAEYEQAYAEGRRLSLAEAAALL